MQELDQAENIRSVSTIEQALAAVSTGKTAYKQSRQSYTVCDTKLSSLAVVKASRPAAITRRQPATTNDRRSLGWIQKRESCGATAAFVQTNRRRQRCISEAFEE